VFDKSVAKHYGVTQDTLVAFKDFDDKKTIYKGETTTKAVEEFIKANSVPLIGEFTEEKSDLYSKRELPIAKFFMTTDRTKNPKQFDYYMNRLKKAAEEYRNKIVTTWAQMSKHDRSVTDYNLKGKEWGLVIEKGYADKYKMEGTKLSVDIVNQFYSDFDEGKVDKWVKSADVPENNNGPVKIVVGKQFEKIVNDPEKDVLIEFYAPWCGHCKSLEPKYEELGKKLKNVESVVIAKIDATANDYPKDFEVSGYPTIFLVPAKKGAKPIKYEGDREVEPMYQFIKKKAKIPFEGDKKKKKKKSDDDD
jgi:protein disulfide isomerase